MRFNTDEIKPFYEVRQNLSKAIDEVERDGSEIVIAKHGKPVAALLSAAGLYRYRATNRLMDRLLDVLAHRTEAGTETVEAQIAEIAEQIKALGENEKSGGKA